MRLLLIVLGASALAAVAFALYQNVMEFEGEEIAFADFADNGARLAFLREKGFVTSESCAPEVRDLAYVGAQDRWITFVLAAGEEGATCFEDPALVLPPEGEDSPWQDCAHQSGDGGLHRYTCADR